MAGSNNSYRGEPVIGTPFPTLSCAGRNKKVEWTLLVLRAAVQLYVSWIRQRNSPK